MENQFLNCLYLVVEIISILGRTNTNPSTANPISKLLSKFHQNDYKLVYERSELVRSDTGLVKAEIRTFKYNRTTPVSNGSFVSTTNMEYEPEIIVQIYRFASNEYREFPIRCQFTLCEILASEAFGLNKLSKSGNIICPFVKGKKYFFYNFAPDESQFPSFIPSGRYLLELQILYHSKEVFVVNNYGTVDRPIVVPKY